MPRRPPARASSVGVPRGTQVSGRARVLAFFAERRWEPFDFQTRAWEAYLAGRGGLIHAPTGLGKTLAAIGGPLIEALDAGESPTPAVVWLTPLRALAHDTASALREAARGVGLGWRVEMRTGDTSASARARQRDKPPHLLVTTPESLSVLLSYADARERLGRVRAIIADEWHELMGNKRGVQAELAIARLRGWSPGLRAWGISATLGNLDEAASALGGAAPEIIRGVDEKAIEARTLIPENVERFPWAGHMGTAMLPAVLSAIESAGTTLVFTNTRSQAELWFKRIMQARPDWLGSVAIHHGSLDRKIRGGVETMLGEAGERRLRCVVCTSSLDLGVDFPPVDQVIQVGSPKGVGRLLQRAGRSGHRPGATSRVVCVPTHAMELVEFSAAREAIEARAVEPRPAPRAPMDVLAQHLVTVACGGGFDEAELLAEVRSTHAYAGLADAQWRWAMDFVSRGGATLGAYPQYARVKRDDAGRWTIASAALASRHRMGIGTINSSTTMTVRVGARSLGVIEEGFIAGLAPGDKFVFAGRVLELVRVREMTAHARAAKGSGRVPSWDGGKMALSSGLASRVRARLDEARRGEFVDECMRAARPLLELQAAWSAIPASDELLIERWSARGAYHAFLHPLEGRLAHEALAAVIIHRATRRSPMSASGTATDVGIEILTSEPLAREEGEWRALLSPERLLDDLLESLNTTQLARRQFRDIARVAGLIVPTFPGSPRPGRQLQASSDMFYDVFAEFDPGNLLLEQARREMIEGQLEAERLRAAAESIRARRLRIVDIPRLTPLAFPLWAQTLRGIHASSEAWSERVKRMVSELEARAAHEVPKRAPRARRAGR